jgi:hypothetical protein
MPGSTTGRNRRASMAGGTTSERIDVLPESSARGGGLLWIIALLVVGVGIVLWATQWRGKKKQAGPAAAEVVENAPRSGSVAAAPVPDEMVVAPVAAGNPDPTFAADALEGELAGERIFATVQVLGETLDVRSASCGETRLAEIIARHAAELRGGGVLRVRCSETYGTQVFERNL